MPYFLVEGYHFHSAVLLHSHKFQCASDSHKFQCASEQLSRSIVKLMSDFIFHKMTTPWCWFHRLVFLDLVDWQNERNYVFLCHTLGAAPPLDRTGQISSKQGRNKNTYHSFTTTNKMFHAIIIYQHIHKHSILSEKQQENHLKGYLLKIIKFCRFSLFFHLSLFVLFI